MFFPFFFKCRIQSLSSYWLTFLPDAAIGPSIWNYVTEPLLRLSDSQGMDKDNKEILDDGMFQKLKNQGLSEQVNSSI